MYYSYSKFLSPYCILAILISNFPVSTFSSLPQNLFSHKFIPGDARLFIFYGGYLVRILDLLFIGFLIPVEILSLLSTIVGNGVGDGLSGHFNGGSFYCYNIIQSIVK